MTFPDLKIWKCHFFVVSLQRVSKRGIFLRIRVRKIQSSCSQGITLLHSDMLNH